MKYFPILRGGLSLCQKYRWEGTSASVSGCTWGGLSWAGDVCRSGPRLWWGLAPKVPWNPRVGLWGEGQRHKPTCVSVCVCVCVKLCECECVWCGKELISFPNPLGTIGGI